MIVTADLSFIKDLLICQVPNIKFNVAKMLERLIPLVDASVVEHTIKPCLLELNEDSDTDVRFYAKQALASCDVVTAA